MLSTWPSPLSPSAPTSGQRLSGSKSESLLLSKGKEGRLSWARAGRSLSWHWAPWALGSRQRSWLPWTVAQRMRQAGRELGLLRLRQLGTKKLFVHVRLRLCPHSLWRAWPLMRPPWRLHFPELCSPQVMNLRAGRPSETCSQPQGLQRKLGPGRGEDGGSGRGEGWH